MYQAQTESLQQGVNLQLINLRESELDYFTNFFSNFGTQSALIAGCVLCAYTNIDALVLIHDNNSRHVWWISCGICMGLSIHLMITSTFLNVYAPGLALRGPSGSMARAVNGMKAEQDTMIFVYILLISFFSIAIMSMFFVITDQFSAYVCNTIFAIQLLIMCNSCSRLYNRFKFDAIDAGAFKSGKKSERASVGETSSRRLTSNPLYLDAQNTSMSGFLMLQSKGGMFSSSSWVRKYFVLKKMQIRFYNSKNDYEMDEQASVNPRPIDMHFLVFRVIYNTQGVSENKFTIEDPDSDCTEVDRYVLMCDSDEEFESWKSCLMKVKEGAKASLSNEFQHEGGFVDIK